MRPVLSKITRRRDRRSSDSPENAELEQLTPDERAIVERVRPHTMTSVARIVSLVDAVRHLVRRDIPGDFAECGVWRGGSVMAMVLALQQLGREDRDIHLFDTFEGMTEPTAADVSAQGSALEIWQQSKADGEHLWADTFGEQAFGERQVVDLLATTGYPAERLHVVRGAVEETIPTRAPSEIALLRLDTDWYESTRHELEHLYPRLVSGGVLIIDDYGHWEGARRAVDEYFDSVAPRPLLNRIDYTARIAIKG